ncbi:SsrA-binding protein [Chitinophaga sp. YR627]|uniref:SsrA-binding protein n=1 Tax=Chitinophaga pinensis (strain ATCC 43595 / DSM 2588 / LMG 13176 / NBRC 15968 / NCIMB 11800 / UQM 2034) TaxID=485918 RepID=A0A979G570_CHIPD|nr:MULTISPECIES: SsrA-binding protein SmpB [Chitinophaga]ACU61125.1 SsrA-binding protein [Chitinophaga pinensis DSM 2588]SFN02053.1 SsrA-binding protein [Chitinophaga sp. YR627]
MAELKNRSAYFEYAIEDKYIAGMVLTGTEIKSIRGSRVSFNDSFCYFSKGELFVKSLHISEYTHGTYSNHDPLRERKLLLTKRELRKLENKIKERGYSIIPLRIFITDKSLAKIEIGLGKGKKLHDKRDSIKQRETDREIRRFLK